MTEQVYPRVGDTYFDNEIESQLLITSISEQEILYDILPSREFTEGGDGMATPSYFKKLTKQRKVELIEKE